MSDELRAPLDDAALDDLRRVIKQQAAGWPTRWQADVLCKTTLLRHAPALLAEIDRLRALLAALDQDHRVLYAERALAEALRKAQRPGSVLAEQTVWTEGSDAATGTGRWYWLWGTEGGGIGHEDASEAELRVLNAAVVSRDNQASDAADGWTCRPCLEGNHVCAQFGIGGCECARRKHRDNQNDAAVVVPVVHEQEQNDR